MQRAAFNFNIHMMAIACMFVFVACKPLKMYTHKDSGADTYCVYKITSVDNTGTMPALKIGDIICLYCSGPNHCVLYTKQRIKVYEVWGKPGTGLYTKKDTGISYYLESEDPSASCTGCPSTNKFELLNY